MSRAWAPEHVVGIELARELVTDQFPEIAAERFEPFGAGWDNTGYLVDDRWVFRFPRRTIAAGLVEIEARVLPHIAGALPLAVPVPRWVGRPDRGYPWAFAGYERLPGRTADVAALDDEQRTAAAPVLGGFLRTLHGLDTAGLDVPADTIARADMSVRIPDLLARAGTLEAAGALPQAPAIRRLIEITPVRSPVYGVLCHGDLYARHLLVDDEGILTGVIDWGDVHVGDRAVDLAIAHGFLPPHTRPAFLDAYGEVDEPTWTLARLRALHHAVAVAAYGHDVGDGPQYREAMVAIGHVLAA